MQPADNNPNQEEVSIPVKITDYIFMGDEVIAQVIESIVRTSNGLHSTRSRMLSIVQVDTVLITLQLKECVSLPLTGLKAIYSTSLKAV